MQNKFSDNKDARWRIRVNGYTLIELLIYLSILSLFLLLATQLFISVKSSSAYSQVLSQLVESSQLIFQDISREIKEADVISVPTSGNSSTVLSLNNGQIVYQVQSGILGKATGGQTYSLHSDSFSVTALNFENVSLATQAASIRVNLSLKSNYFLEGGRQVEESFQTALTQRVR